MSNVCCHLSGLSLSFNNKSTASTLWILLWCEIAPESLDLELTVELRLSHIKLVGQENFDTKQMFSRVGTLTDRANAEVKRQLLLHKHERKF